MESGVCYLMWTVTNNCLRWFLVDNVYSILALHLEKPQFLTGRNGFLKMQFEMLCYLREETFVAGILYVLGVDSACSPLSRDISYYSKGMGCSGENTGSRLKSILHHSLPWSLAKWHLFPHLKMGRIKCLHRWISELIHVNYLRCAHKHSVSLQT